MHHLEKLIMGGAAVPNKLSSIKHDDYREEVEAAKPSDKPEFWAKQDCKHCYGKGVVGKTTTTVAGGNKIVNNQICQCATKAWQDWQARFIEQLKKAKQKAIDSRISSDQESGGQRKFTSVKRQVSSVEQSRADSKAKLTLERLQRIDDLLKPLQRKAEELEQRKVDLPHREAVRQAESAFLARGQEQAELQHLAIMKEKQAVQLEEEAEHYRTMAKDAVRQAANLRQQVNSEVKPEISKAAGQVEEARQGIDHAKRELARMEHQLSKKIRETQTKIDKLAERRSRVVSETGLDPDFTPEIPISADTPA
jgi:chromosome segregation ATPase